MHSSFWREYKEISDYIKRCCSLNTDGVNRTDIAILCTEQSLPDALARPLYRHQMEFNYLERSLLPSVVLRDGKAHIAGQSYRVILRDESYDEATEGFLAAFREAGGVVVDHRDFAEDEDAFLAALRSASSTLTDLDHHPDLRLTRVEKYGVEVLFLSNEGEEPVTTTLRETVAEIWDSERGTRRPHGEDSLTLTLRPRESVHLIMGDPTPTP